VDLGPDQVRCAGEVATLNAFSGQTSSYLWNTGQNTDTISVTATGLYIVTVTNTCGRYFDQVNVSFIEPPSISGNDTVICEGERAVLYPSITGANQISWSTGATTSRIEVAQAGTYTVSAQNSCFTRSDSFEVVLQELPIFSLGEDTTLCGNSILLAGPTQNGYRYEWNNTQESPTLLVADSGTYQLTVWNAEGCAYSDAITIFKCPLPLFIPQAFTPNGDGLNDYFFAVTDPEQILDYRFMIFNRWGELIFETQDPEIGWNGEFNGEPAPIGSYAYRLFLRPIDSDNETIEKHGSIQLIR